MILSAKIIRQPKKIRICDKCGFPIVKQQLKLYGSAFCGEKPYNIFMHPDCYTGDDKKVMDTMKCAGRPAEGE